MKDKAKSVALKINAPSKKSGHVTLSDIARVSGFSTSTVSLVLSEAPLSKNVAAKTRAHVKAIAKKLGYHPDAYARSLRRRHTQTIAVLAFDLTDPFCLPILHGIQHCLQDVAYSPLLMDAKAQRKLFDKFISLALESRADGIIVIASWLFDETNLLADILKNHVPIVVIGRDLTAIGVSSISVDNEAGGFLAMEHIASLGHSRIAVIRGPQELWDSEPRWNGIQRAATKTGIKIDPAMTFQLPSLGDPVSGFEGGLQFTQKLLAEKRKFSAVIAFDDMTALGVLRGLTKAGIRVPQDCSIMGFDDVLPASVSTPAISTVRQPLFEMGSHAAEQILNEIKRTDGKKSRPWVLHPSPELLVRDSTAAKSERR